MQEAVVKMDDENAFKTGPVRCVSAKTYLRLRFLEKEIVASTFEGLLSATEVTELMQRRDMVRPLDQALCASFFRSDELLNDP